MKINTFALERYFAKHEFSARYLLSSSDCESLGMSELVAMADEQTRGLWDGLKLGYTESPGHHLLRGEIAALYDSTGIENTLVAAPEECIYLFMHALLVEGDHVICTFPGYQSLYEVARSIGCSVSLWSPDEEQGWRFDLEWLRREIREETKLVVVNFPHNPTGFLPGKGEILELVELVREMGVYLLSDEMYRGLELEDGAALPSACGLYDRAVTLSGLSKSYGLPGLRIGWVASKASDVLYKMAALKDYTTICSSAPSEILGIIALRNRERIVSAQLERVRLNVKMLDEFMQGRQDIFEWNRPSGGSICFPRMLMVEDTHAFCERLVEEAGIMLAPSRVFQYGDRHVRIGYGREDFSEVLDRFGEYLEKS